MAKNAAREIEEIKMANDNLPQKLQSNPDQEERKHAPII